MRKGESYASSWGADAIVVFSGLTNASETLDRILNSLAFTDTYSETEFTSAVSALRNCQVSLSGSKPPLREVYEAVLQLAAQGCDAYQSALDQLPQAMGSDDYFPFSGVQAALMQGDARFASVGYELDRAVGVLGLSGGSTAPAPTPDYNAPAPESSYGGDLDCVDFDGQSMSPAGIHMVSMAMAMAMESAVNDRRRAARWLERALPYRGIGFALTRADEVLRRRSTVIEVCCIDLCTTVIGWRGS